MPGKFVPKELLPFELVAFAGRVGNQMKLRQAQDFEPH
jgi:hypothetical protein